MCYTLLNSTGASCCNLISAVAGVYACSMSTAFHLSMRQHFSSNVTTHSGQYKLCLVVEFDYLLVGQIASAPR